MENKTNYKYKKGSLTLSASQTPSEYTLEGDYFVRSNISNGNRLPGTSRSTSSPGNRDTVAPVDRSPFPHNESSHQAGKDSQQHFSSVLCFHNSTGCWH